MLLDLNKNNFDLFINKNPLVLIEFYAPWCQNCLQQEFILEEILEEHFDQIKIYKINVESESEISDKYQVFNLPTLILFEKGIVSKTLINLYSKNKLMEWLKI